MAIATILSILSFAIAEGPTVYTMTTKLIADIQTTFKDEKECNTALNNLLLMMTPMEKEV